MAKLSSSSSKARVKQTSAPEAGLRDAKFDGILPTNGTSAAVVRFEDETISTLWSNELRLLHGSLASKDWDGLLRQLSAIGLYYPREGILSHVKTIFDGYIERNTTTYESALSALNHEERAYIKKAFSNAAVRLSELCDTAVEGSPQASSAGRLRQPQQSRSIAAQLPHLVAALQHLDAVMTVVETGLSQQSAFSPARFQWTPELVNGAKPEEPRPGARNRSAYQLRILGELQAPTPSRASSIITTSTNITATTMSDENHHSIDLAISGVSFRIAHDGSRITSSDQFSNPPPPYVSTAL